MLSIRVRDPHHLGFRVPPLQLIAAALLLSCAGSLGCTLLSNRTIAQCETTAECAARGGEFSGTICAEDKFCRQPTPSETGCTTNLACSQEIGGLPAICPTVGGACQPLLSDDCGIVFGDYENDEAIPIGLMVPLTGPLEPVAPVYTTPVELALEELAVRAIGLPGVGAERRPIIAVVCDEAANPTRAATFLVENVKVPAMIGPIDSVQVLEVATTVTIDAGVLLVTPVTGAPTLRQLEDDGLVWHTIASLEASVRAQSAHLEDYVEPAVRTRLDLMSDPIRVLVISEAGTTPLSYADAAVSTLVFNGQSALDNGDNFLRRDYAPGDAAAAVVDAIAFQPHVVVAYGFSDIYSNVLPEIDAALADKPHYLMSSLGYLHPLLSSFASSDDVATRLTGVTDTALSGPVADTFAVAYRGKYGTDPYSNSAFTYDAAYAVMYAMAAAGHVPEITGNAAAVGMTKLVDGMSLPVGAAQIPSALGTLPNGGTVDLEGASGTLSWDTATGDVVSISRVYCINSELQQVVTEQVYDQATNTLSGVYSCP